MRSECPRSKGGVQHVAVSGRCLMNGMTSHDMLTGMTSVFIRLTDESGKLSDSLRDTKLSLVSSSYWLARTVTLSRSESLCLCLESYEEQRDPRIAQENQTKIEQGLNPAVVRLHFCFESNPDIQN